MMFSLLAFPKLRDTGFKITSPPSVFYNCIAWAGGDQGRVWWPDPMGIGYWPEGLPREETLSAFVTAFEKLGYQVCDDGRLESGYEKVALYAKEGKPTHAARQLQSGYWTSKLGRLEDIEHEDEEGVSGPVYGEPILFMKRACQSHGKNHSDWRQQDSL